MRTKLTRDLLKFSDQELMNSISDRRRVFELLAVLLTAIGKFLFMDYLNWRLPFVIISIVGWAGYIYNRHRKCNKILNYWGFRKDNFTLAIKLMLPFATISIIVFFVIGYFQDTINVTWHIIPILMTYPIWGSIQQFLIIALVSGNLKDIKSVKLKNWLIVVITAVLFSVVHFPSVWLMLGTFVLALFYTLIYFKIKNVYAMGLFHGWLGALFYYTVVGSDPFQEIFLKMF